MYKLFPLVADITEKYWTITGESWKNKQNLGKSNKIIENLTTYDIIYTRVNKERKIYMKKNKEQKIKNKEQRKYDKGQIFIKIMAGFLALLMVVATGGTLIYALIG